MNIKKKIVEIIQRERGESNNREKEHRIIIEKRQK